MPVDPNVSICPTCGEGDALYASLEKHEIEAEGRVWFVPIIVYACKPCHQFVVTAVEGPQ